MIAKSTVVVESRFHIPVTCFSSATAIAYIRILTAVNRFESDSPVAQICWIVSHFRSSRCIFIDCK